MSVLNTENRTFHTTSVMPQVAHKNIVSRKEGVSRTIHFLFSVSEVLSIAFIFVFLYYYRLSQEFGQSIWDKYGLSSQLPRFFEYSVFFAIVLLLWLAWAYNFKLFSIKRDVSSSFLEEVSKCIKALSYSVLITVGIAFVFKLTDYSRFVVLVFWLSSICVSFSLRGMKHLLLVSLAKKGILLKNVIVIGAGKVGQLISNELTAKPGLGYNVLGFIDDEKKGSIDSTNILGKFKDIDKIIKRYPIDEIIITIPTERKLINEFLNRFRKYNITIRIVPEMFNLVSKTIEVETVHSVPYITLIKTPMRGVSYLFKRGLDFILTMVGLFAITPLLLITAMLIKLDSPGPVIYKQRRVGRNGKFFAMYKFRSMVENAEATNYKLANFNEVNGAAFKIKEDPRVTKVGRFIRKYSIDELPQLLNVLKGDMSLIGPRPPLPKEVEEYSDWEWRRLEVVPGITGLWQVSGRSELSFEQWVNLDIYYIENWNLWMDFKILLKTIPAVIKGEGAY
jgi:exopolysaccharide biosynthesis polyprenyl glycosylphosphotransferase